MENQKTGSNNLVVILLIVVSFFAGYLFFKNKNLEQQKSAPSGGTANVTEAPTSPLSIDNLKRYAKDLGLNISEFNNCLDKGEKSQEVSADQQQGISLGVQGTPAFFVNGKFLGGAFPYDDLKDIIDKEIANKSSNNPKDYNQQLQQAYNSAPRAFEPVPKKVYLKGASPEGNPDAKVTIVEFSDFQCPYCIRAYSTVKKILETYPNDVAIYYKQFPLSQIHPFAQKAAEASLCAQNQNKFWDYANNLFKVQGG